MTALLWQKWENCARITEHCSKHCLNGCKLEIKMAFSARIQRLGTNQIIETLTLKWFSKEYLRVSNVWRNVCQMYVLNCQFTYNKSVWILSLIYVWRWTLFLFFCIYFHSSYVGHPVTIPTSCTCTFRNHLLLSTYLPFSFHTTPFQIFCCHLDVFLLVFSISFTLQTWVLHYAA